jgi:hypothetical protein
LKKYIECEKLIKALKIWQNKIVETYGKNDEYVKCLGSILLGIDQIPAADVRHVVYCKDCKCYQQSSFVDKHMECARSKFPVHSVDFCSFGEKKEKAND